MKGLIFLAGVLIVVVGLCGPAKADAENSTASDGSVGSFTKVDPPKSLTPLSFKDANGRPRHLSEFRGKVTLVNLWASWCPPCLRELPALDRLQKTFGKGAFSIVAISIDRKGKVAAEKIFKRLGIKNLELFMVPPGVAGETFPIDTIPANFIINRQGELTSYRRSYVDWDNQEAMTFVFDLVTAPD